MAANNNESPPSYIYNYNDHDDRNRSNFDNDMSEM